MISLQQNFLVSALRDAVANTMNRSSDYFALPLGIYMQHSDQTYLDMYQLHINLENNPVLVREISKLEAVRKHLACWVNKYQSVFLGRDDMCLLYVGVEDGVPFPKDVDQAVSAWIEEHS